MCALGAPSLRKNDNFAFEEAATANSIDEVAQAKNGSTHANLPSSSTTSGGGKVAGRLAKGADEITAFVNKTLPQKLDDIKNIWNTKYLVQEMLEGRCFFEDVMGQYRYTKSSGWAHTADISDNFKVLIFIKDLQKPQEIFILKLLYQ